MKTATRASILVCGCILGVHPAHPVAEEYARDLRSSVPSVRVHTAMALGRIGHESAVPVLIEALKDPEKDVRREAAKALGFIKDARAVAALAEAIGDSDMNVRLYAAYALGEIKNAKSTGALLRALRDPEWCVRDQAAWALREIHDPKIIAPLAAALKEKDADLAHIAWVMRHVAGKHAVEELAALMKSADAQARTRIIRVLGELEDRAAVGPLIEVLEDGDPVVRRTAVEALLRIGDDRAEKPLTALLARENEPAVRKAVQEAIVQMSCEKDLVAHWSFDDRNTKVAKDVTGHGNDGQIQGCTPVAGKVGHALRFGKAKYIALGKPAGLPIAQRPLTIMAWVKSDAPSGVVIARGGAFCGFSLYIKDGIAKFGIHRLQEGPAYIAPGCEKVVGSWVHLAGVVKKDCIELYVNGKRARTAGTNGYIPGNCGQSMEIGYDLSNSPAEITDPFEGIIDEVKVYHAALCGDDIAKQCRPEKK